jgi:hypothetical protein
VVPALYTDMEIIQGIYLIQNSKNGKMYIGQSKNIYSRYELIFRLFVEICIRSKSNRMIQSPWLHGFFLKREEPI